MQHLSFNPQRLIPSTKFRAPTSSSCSFYPPASAISSVNKRRGIHSDIQITSQFGHQPGVGGGCLPDTIQPSNHHPLMSTSSTETIPLQPHAGTGHQHLPLQDQPQIHRVTSPAQGSTSTTSTAVQNHFDRVKPTWVVHRYERSTKLKPPFIDLKLAPLKTSFADRWASLKNQSDF